MTLPSLAFALAFLLLVALASFLLLFLPSFCSTFFILFCLLLLDAGRRRGMGSWPTKHWTKQFCPVLLCSVPPLLWSSAPRFSAQRRSAVNRHAMPHCLQRSPFIFLYLPSLPLVSLPAFCLASSSFVVLTLRGMPAPLLAETSLRLAALAAHVGSQIW